AEQEQQRRAREQEPNAERIAARVQKQRGNRDEPEVVQVNAGEGRIEHRAVLHERDQLREGRRERRFQTLEQRVDDQVIQERDTNLQVRVGTEGDEQAEPAAHELEVGGDQRFV